MALSLESLYSIIYTLSMYYCWSRKSKTYQVKSPEMIFLHVFTNICNPAFRETTRFRFEHFNIIRKKNTNTKYLFVLLFPISPGYLQQWKLEIRLDIQVLASCRPSVCKSIHFFFWIVYFSSKFHDQTITIKILDPNEFKKFSLSKKK